MDVSQTQPGIEEPVAPEGETVACDEACQQGFATVSVAAVIMVVFSTTDGQADVSAAESVLPGLQPVARFAAYAPGLLLLCVWE